MRNPSNRTPTGRHSARNTSRDIRKGGAPVKGSRRDSHLWAVLYGVVLAVFTTFVLLDTFVIPRSGTAMESSGTVSTSEADTAAATVTDTSYKDSHISIQISQEREYSTDIYVVDVQVSDVSYLKTAFADSQYGRNIKQTTSAMATANNAILAINGDYYGFRDSGYVIRNGTLYRSTAESGTDALVVGSDGGFSTVSETSTSAESLLSAGAWQVFSFGPTLVSSGQIAVSTTTEVDQSMTSNPRTAIGMISPLHYVFIVSDGRTSASSGLSLYQLAQVFQEQGCQIAYNLDGGGSTTLWFNGKVINNPTTNGKTSSEREVSDIVYI